MLDRARLGVPFAMRPTLLRNTGAPLRGRRPDGRALVRPADPGPRAGRRRPGRRRPARRCRRRPRRARRRLAQRLARRSFPDPRSPRPRRPPGVRRPGPRHGRRAVASGSALVTSGGSYLPPARPRVVFGLGPAAARRTHRGGLALGRLGVVWSKRQSRRTAPSYGSDKGSVGPIRNSP